MAVYVYCPDHPNANEHGMVTKQEKAEWYYATQYEDKRMMKGNEPVTLRFISDGMDYTLSMFDGKRYTSKAKYRAEMRAHGCVEVGNETKYLTKPRRPDMKGMTKKERVEDIKKAIYQHTGKA